MKLETGVTELGVGWWVETGVDLESGPFPFLSRSRPEPPAVAGSDPASCR